MKMLFDLFPVILFFAAFKFQGIFVATAVAIAASVLQIAVTWLWKRKVDPMMWIGFAVITLFGGTTLLLHNEVFIKWKPTILYWIFAGVIFGAKVFSHKNIMRGLLGKQLSVPAAAWNRFNTSWGIFFAAVGALNLFVAYHFSTSTWVNFKLFGIMGLMLVFVVVQSLLLAPFIGEEGNGPDAAGE
jgi:intracellular septation protein